jgi:hypothetical protein
MTVRIHEKRRAFNSDLGDRVARDPNNNKNPAYNFTEAFQFAWDRALKTGYRQQMRASKPKKRGPWWLVYMTNIPLKEGDGSTGS